MARIPRPFLICSSCLECPASQNQVDFASPGRFPRAGAIDMPGPSRLLPLRASPAPPGRLGGRIDLQGLAVGGRGTFAVPGREERLAERVVGVGRGRERLGVQAKEGDRVGQRAPPPRVPPAVELVFGGGSPRGCSRGPGSTSRPAAAPWLSSTPRNGALWRKQDRRHEGVGLLEIRRRARSPPARRAARAECRRRWRPAWACTSGMSCSPTSTRVGTLMDPRRGSAGGGYFEPTLRGIEVLRGAPRGSPRHARGRPSSRAR